METARIPEGKKRYRITLNAEATDLFQEVSIKANSTFGVKSLSRFIDGVIAEIHPVLIEIAKLLDNEETREEGKRLYLDLIFRRMEMMGALMEMMGCTHEKMNSHKK